MASAATVLKLQLRPRCHSHFQVIDPVRAHIKVSGAWKCQMHIQGFLVSAGGRRLRHTFLPASAVGSGRDSSITEADRKSDLSLENVKTSVVSRDDEKINVRVQLPGKATQKVFDEALIILARDAPPVPGFRKSKGGIDPNKCIIISLLNVTYLLGWHLRSPFLRVCLKQFKLLTILLLLRGHLLDVRRENIKFLQQQLSTEHRLWCFCLQIPSSILLQMLGKGRVTKFVLQEILNITIEEFVKKENLKVKPEIKTTQSESEMESAFTPGSAFGFNVILRLEKSDSDEGSEEQPDSLE
ncbi:hypothetical protein U9M48_016873 [Paspalum notatum var. saurae]|uniref:Trigger factor ribosome-binding bacterial domain-containing protein n=1 Tax=Paspalum notatum var. saurae TaxID=547442 RepID=A0AAQ3T7C4_PASNO